MEKLAREIVRGLKWLGMQPTEKNIAQAARRQHFCGNIDALLERVSTLWDKDYFPAYIKWYRNQHSPKSAAMLEENCKHVTGRIWDEHAGKFIAERSLVMGDIQAGKTANFIGQMAMATDQGVRLFIVLTGVTNMLRSQTQKRIEEGFGGISSENFERVGVGKDKDYTLPYLYTTRMEDKINPSAVHPAMLGVPGVIVIKKCKVALEWLLEWVEHQKTIYGLLDAPMLVIDDEADLASLNRKGKDEDESVINGLITDILNCFPNSSYLGYTATPFDNLAGNDDLKPKDILCCLPEPGKNYFGPRQLFLNPAHRDRVIRHITDAADNKVAYMKRPDSLYKAFRTFLVARAIYALEHGEDAACCMLVNVAHENDDQYIVNTRLNNYWNTWRNKLYNANAADSIWEGLKQLYKEEFEDDYPGRWQGIRGYLRRLCGQTINFHLVNGETDNPEEIHKSLTEDRATSVLTGGYALARGITLPRLLVSYVIRPNARDAALMQLGRWFGYRGQYVKLCRIWMTEEMHQRFEDVTQRIASLKAQINNLDPDLRFEEQDWDLNEE